jgi:nucleoside-diphosphate-sugar epimerase
MGVGFVGGRYCAMYPDAMPEPRYTVKPTRDDVLFTRSTVDNYAPLHGDFHTDIETNLLHLTEVLPHVSGIFNFVSSWFTVANAGQCFDSPAREDDLCDPNGYYSATKACAEHLVRSHTQTAQAGLIPGPRAYRILRLGNVLGIDPRASKTKNALVHLLAKVKAGEDVTVYTGDCLRDVMHVDDTCRAIRLCLERGTLDTIYHIGYGTSVRTIDLIEHAKGVTGSHSRITLVAPPRFHQIVQVPDFHFCTAKLRGLGFVPDMDPYQAVERVLANL